jgi:3-oxo-5-alpha-steroid 4-dehydrogenase 1
MTEAALYAALLKAGFALALVTALYLCVRTAPYGRHARAGYGPAIDNALGWVLMEAPASLLPLGFVVASGRWDALTLVLLAIWEFHYAHRAFVYPLSIRGRGARMPLAVCMSGASFNVLNAYLNFRFIAALGPVYPPTWLGDPRFLSGLGLFALGTYLNRSADRTLRGLRAPGDRGYKIPRGGLYRFISCPNYFGELLAWCGWALLCWSPPALFFALFTAANLVPRAVSHHRDYLARFPDYPPERRAILPFVL